ncbi:unnamed protein product [Ilex paraguariensis]
MGDHMVSCVDRFIAPESLQPPQAAGALMSAGNRSCGYPVDRSTLKIDIEEGGENCSAGEEEPLIPNVECRICQEEDSIKNLEIPCFCNGSLKFAHRNCVQRWCNEKGDITCEICNQPYQPGYTAPAHPEDTTIDISGGWTIAGTPLDLHDPRLLAMAATERHLLEAEYDETSASGTAFCRSAVLILMALLLLKHTLTFVNGDGDEDDVSTFFSLFLLRAAGFLLPCYIMAWVISILQRRRQGQEAEAFLLQADQHRGLPITIAPGPAATPEPAVTSLIPGLAVSSSSPGFVVIPHPEPLQ